ncbi:MAG: class I SAM-dependent methyltransferase [Acidimicrobiales bacterium]
MSGPPTPMVPLPDDEFAGDTYGSSFADVYDEWYADASDAEATARFLDDFGSEQKVVELGVGTGRLSTPVARSGHRVVGFDISAAMLERLSSTPGVTAVRGDMAVLAVASGAVDTVLVATNTFFNLTTKGAQEQCLTEARRVLRIGGRLIVEAFVPDDPHPGRDRLVTTRSIDLDRVVLTATIRSPDDQTITGQHIEISESGIRLRPWKVRFAAPEELDAMATAAGFRLGDRWEDWERSPFTDQSSRAVTVYVAV